MTEHHLETDYFVVGAGAAGMAFTDTMISESDARVIMIDRRHAPGGHWLDAYPFVRLHQPSAFYGVDSTPLGTDKVQADGPEPGMYERATAAEICAYYMQVMDRRLLPSGRVRFYPQCEHVGGQVFRSILSGDTFHVTVRKKVVDARYLAPDIPACTPPPFGVSSGASYVPVNGLAHLRQAPAGYAIIGAGKTAIDACLWLLGNGVDPATIRWIRPHDAWLTNRAYMQPRELIGSFLLGVTLIMESAAQASTLDDVFDRLERAEFMRRIDPQVRPTMARVPTVSDWELEQLRRIENVVRLGHVRSIEKDRIVLDQGAIPTSPQHLHVHCAAHGLRRQPLVPIFGADRITLQPVRTGLVPFGAALTAFVEAHRGDDGEKNRICRPSPLPHVMVDWARTWLISTQTDRGLANEPDIRQWIDRTRLNPACGHRARRTEPAVHAAMRRFAASVGPALARLGQLAALPSSARDVRPRHETAAER